MALIDDLRAKLAEAEAALHTVLTKGALTDVWRDGRRVRYSAVDTADLRAYIADLKAQIGVLDPGGVEAGQSRRAIGVRF